MNEKKRVFITGANGFIGRYLVAEALRRGYVVDAGVRITSCLDGLEHPDITFVEIDYSSEEAVAQLINSYPNKARSLVIHNAGITKARSKTEFIEINARQTERFVGGLAASDFPPERFVLMSSMGSYGPPPLNDEPLTCHHPQHPTNAYGRSKLLAEEAVKKSSLPYTILQPTGVYGPGDKDYLLSYRAIAHGVDFLSGRTPQQLTFVHAADVAAAAFFLAEHPQAVNRSFIISDGHTYTDMEYGRMVQRLLGLRFVWHWRCPLPLVRFICEIGQLWGNLTGHHTALNHDKYAILRQRNWRCDATPLFDLGFQPRYNLENGLAETIRHALQNHLL